MSLSGCTMCMRHILWAERLESMLKDDLEGKMKYRAELVELALNEVKSSTTPYHYRINYLRMHRRQQ